MRLWGALCSLLLAGNPPAEAETGPDWVRRSRPLLGTFVTISACGLEREALHGAINAAFASFERVDELMSIHREDSELSRVNAEAGFRPVKVSDELFEVLARAQAISARTGGAFDVTLRPLADLWGFIWKEYRLPTEEERLAALARVGYRRIELNPQEHTVRFLEEGVSVDLGGIAKGFAVDLAIEQLRKAGVPAAMVKAGGDLRVLGMPPGSDYWEVQLEDPEKHGRRVVIRLRGGALSTSGDYENFFVVEGRRYSHILDPRTGMPVRGVAACSVTAPTCMASDAWATALFVYGAERSLEEFGDELGIRFSLVDMDKAGDVVRSIRQSNRFPEEVQN